jgi:hypothetical protein
MNRVLIESQADGSRDVYLNDVLFNNCVADIQVDMEGLDLATVRVVLEFREAEDDIDIHFAQPIGND